MSDKAVAKTDVVLVGAGIMSATLGALLRLVEPDWNITLVERLDAAAAESSDPWNNAGTGHSGIATEDVRDEDWLRVMDVNLNGMSGVEALFPGYLNQLGSARMVSRSIQDSIEGSVDVIKAGDPSQPVTGIVTTFLATHEVLQRAVDLGARAPGFTHRRSGKMRPVFSPVS